MKTNMKQKGFRAVAIVAAFIMAMSPISAYAQVEEEPKCSCAIKCTPDDIDNNCEICSYDYTKCEGLCLDDDYEEHYGPLTPDGNMELVDDYGSMEAGGKQFITVITKTGNYFYIIIDRDDDGNENVHFLNMVDESDLLALMDEEQIDEYIAVTRNKKVEPVPTEIVKEEKTEPEPVVEEKKTSSPLVALILIMILGGGAGYVYYTKKKETKQNETETDPDADYVETESFEDAFDIEADDKIEYLDDEDDIENLDKEMESGK